ncbi:MAG: MBL fold metallo-hydrolase [Betaproteobacteria bacterium]|nr:MBL fold metallo-hydrolase [Betaproteobacteria bacterium]
MYFRQIADRSDGALTYVLGNLAAQEAVVIDPAPRQRAVVQALLAERKLALRWILYTQDHDGGGDAAMPTLAGAQAGAVGIVGGSDGAGGAHRVGDGDTVTFGDEVLHVLATPGHTAGSVSYLWRDRLFCGDALELGGRGPAIGPGADAGQLYDSVTQKLFTLPGETLVFPGHTRRGRTVSTIAEERLHNPHFAGRTRDAFVAACSRRASEPARASDSSRNRNAGAARRTVARSAA